MPRCRQVQRTVIGCEGASGDAVERVPARSICHRPQVFGFLDERDLLDCLVLVSCLARPVTVPAVRASFIVAILI